MKEAAADSQLHRINNALRVGTMQMRAEELKRSPEWKALEKEMKARKWSRQRRMMVFTTIMNRPTM